MRRLLSKVYPVLSVEFGLTLAAGLVTAQDAPVRINPSEAKDLVVKRVQPEYPKMAKQMKLTGQVELDAVIDDSGKVESVKVIKGNPLLTGSARAALKQWKFTPIERNGKPVRAACVFAFNFTN